MGGLRPILLKFILCLPLRGGKAIATPSAPSPLFTPLAICRASGTPALDGSSKDQNDHERPEKARNPDLLGPGASASAVVRLSARDGPDR